MAKAMFLQSKMDPAFFRSVSSRVLPNRTYETRSTYGVNQQVLRCGTKLDSFQQAGSRFVGGAAFELALQHDGLCRGSKALQDTQRGRRGQRAAVGPEHDDV